MVMEFERAQLPEGLDPEVGMGLQMQGPQGQPIPVQIMAVAEATVTIDANHPLAGQNLNFELELVEVL
jgi:FKBP-type peptidyl-prolyl cis-trans isomerase 2